jgi:hypothetical protein
LWFEPLYGMPFNARGVNKWNDPGAIIEMAICADDRIIDKVSATEKVSKLFLFLYAC